MPLSDSTNEDTGDRRATKSSIRTILEGGILLGIGWIINGNIQQGKDTSAINTKLEFIVKNAEKIPEIDMRVRELEKAGTKTETRLTNLEALERAK